MLKNVFNFFTRTNNIGDKGGLAFAAGLKMMKKLRDIALNFEFSEIMK